MVRRSIKPVNKKTTKNVALDRPFDQDILTRAVEIAHNYRIVLEPVRGSDCEYIGTSLEMPGIFADGQTADACVEAVREALTAAVAYLIESGQTPPVPSDQQART